MHYRTARTRVEIGQLLEPEPEPTLLRIAIARTAPQVANTKVHARVEDLDTGTHVEIAILAVEGRDEGLSEIADRGHEPGRMGELILPCIDFEHPGHAEQRDLRYAASREGCTVVGRARREPVVGLR